MVISLTFKKKQTMKKIFILMASAAVVLAASCNKMEEVNTPVDTPVETEVITIDINPMTKTSLDGKATVWSKGDAVSVTVGDKNIGSLKLVQGSTFSGEVEAGHTGAATLNYPAGVTTVPATQAAVAGSFANGAALLEGTTTMEALRAGEGANLSNTTALLKFSVPQAGDVTFEVGTAKYTITGCKTEEIYYACVAPASGVDFVARIGGYLSNKASNKATFKANQVANLETLLAPVVSTKYGIAGTFQSPTTWDASNPIEMYNDIDGKVIINNVELYKDDAFKVVVDKSWDESYGNGSANMTVEKNGIFDIVFDSETNEITATCIEEYTDVKVILTVKNERTNWGSVYMHLWKENGEEDEPITVWPGASLSADSQGNYTYELDGKYISENIGFIFSDNGTDQTNADYITVSRKGHNLTIASMPPAKFYFVLDTDNSKQWWGTTAYLHMWTSDGDLFGGWPGKLMTYDGDYKFSCDIPAEYINKIVNFKVHNGNGWEGANQNNKTIAAEQTYNGSSIGIN